MNAEFGNGREYLVHFQRIACERLNSSWISDKSSIGVLVVARSGNMRVIWLVEPVGRVLAPSSGLFCPLLRGTSACLMRLVHSMVIIGRWISVPFDPAVLIARMWRGILAEAVAEGLERSEPWTSASGKVRRMSEESSGLAGVALASVVAMAVWVSVVAATWSALAFGFYFSPWL